MVCTLKVLVHSISVCRSKQTKSKIDSPFRVHVKEATLEQKYLAMCASVDFLLHEQFDEVIASKLPWQLSSIIKNPICTDIEGYQQKLADILLNLRNFVVFYTSDTLRGDLIKYQLFKIVQLLFLFELRKDIGTSWQK